MKEDKNKNVYYFICKHTRYCTLAPAARRFGEEEVGIDAVQALQEVHHHDLLIIAFERFEKIFFWKQNFLFFIFHRL